MTPLLLSTLQGNISDKIPFWFMRQAGRYLPEYRDIRKNYPQFLDFCYTPKAAVEVTLQPIRRFDMDAAIMFSDILVLPHALGCNVWFEEGEGPRITPILNQDDLIKLSTRNIESHLAPVFEILNTLRMELAPEKTLIGFAGSPWTIACYMVQGRGQGKDSNQNTKWSGFKLVRAKAKEDPEFFEKLITLITDATIIYLRKQIDSGAQVIQLFDSWAGVLSPQEFTQRSVLPTKKILTEIRKTHPNIPVIGFPRQSGKMILEYVSKTGVSAVSVDESHPAQWVKESLQPSVIVQGGIGNMEIADDLASALMHTDEILSAWKDKPFVFNLAHGILPHTPPEHIAEISKRIKQFKRSP